MKLYDTTAKKHKIVDRLEIRLRDSETFVAKRLDPATGERVKIGRVLGFVRYITTTADLSQGGPILALIENPGFPHFELAKERTTDDFAGKKVSKVLMAAEESFVQKGRTLGRLKEMRD